jgi:type IV pilus assembly protein PilY1
VILISSGAPREDLHDQWPLAFLDTIGNADQDGSECSLPPPNEKCTNAPSTGRDDALVYLHNGSDWLDDVAYYLWDNDLSDLPGKQNLVTYTIGFMVDHPLLEETAQNGDGKYYTTAGGNAEQLMEHLRAAMLDIIERATAFTAASVPASRTSFGDGFYSAYFIPSATKPFWAGHLEAYRLDEAGAIRDVDGNLAIDPLTDTFRVPRRPFWDAATVLRGGGSRNLLTTKSGSYRDEFSTVTIDESDLGLSSSEIGLYPNDPGVPFATLADLADALVNYVHGKDAFDEDRDGDSSELRDVILGDIYHSNPVVIGPPPRGRIDEGYEVAASGTPFVQQYAQRDRVIYLGGNDAILHAFDAGQFLSGDNPLTSGIVEDGYYSAGSGEERFGWVPGLLLDQIKYIPRNVPRSHYYVDGSPTAADVWLPDPNDPSDVSKEPHEWATVLVVGFRQGGPGYLALDITDPDATSPSDPHGEYPKLLWEFNHTNLADSWSQPVITRVKVRGSSGLDDHCGPNDGDGDCRERWVAIFGAGYRKDADPNLATYVGDPSDAAWSDAGKGIFMVALDTGALLASVEFAPFSIWTSTASPMSSTSETSAGSSGSGTSRAWARTWTATRRSTRGQPACSSMPSR